MKFNRPLFGDHTRVERLIKEGLMTSYGQAKIDLAKKNGAWAKLNSSDHFEMPKELNEGLKKNGKASLFWETVAPSSKRGILEWINSAKTEETRIKRIKETVRLAAIRIRANHYLDLKKIEKK
ncbi:MAG: YdeI/OmpD-associated family protein [Silvanigrellaceae bacterium]|nr:YdeI/OmpD-associated family protein [Silvanigrellaceae bacterium]